MRSGAEGSYEHVLQKTNADQGSLIVYRDAEADRYLASPDVQTDWLALWDQCPWATGLQRPEFVGTWYRCYAERYRPLIVVRYWADGRLDGLMTLAVDKRGGALVFAGAFQADYHAWLARPGPQTFITAALNELSRLGFASLTFLCLPPDSPLDWLEGEWRGRSVLQPVRKPLMDVGDGDEARESLRKKSNKSRMNRLARSGPIEFVELKTVEELDRDYDDIIEFTDFRHGAIHSVCPFAEDPYKRTFFRELLRQPEFLHVTVMRAGGKPVAAHIGMRSRREVILGIICYSPFVAEHSPGKLHMLNLALLLQQQGFSALDLTPGGDPYKDRFATRDEQAYLLTVFFDSKQRARTWLRGRVVRAAVALGFRPEKLKQYRSLAVKAISSPARAIRAVARMALTRLWSTTEMRFYRLPAALLPREPPDDAFQRDSLAGLLSYRQDPSLPSKHEFLSGAMAAIEAGAHVYTCVRDNRLIHYGWLSPRATKSFITEVQHEFIYPPNSAVLWNFFTHPSCRGQGLYSRSLRRMLADISLIPDIEFAYIAVLADNWASRRVIEKTGFLYQASIIRRNRLNKTRFTFQDVSGPSGKEAGADASREN
jgi:CelD/BcsL family acetyltransferase involved in cellulose biosynthesis/RimJ/RimL family protein N-acetyltransferase